MKTIVLIRHAKSSWKDEDLDDFDRPLSKRGKREAPIMAEHLKSQNITIEKIFSSPAKRAKKQRRFLLRFFRLKLSIMMSCTIRLKKRFWSLLMMH